MFSVRNLLLALVPLSIACQGLIGGEGGANPIDPVGGGTEDAGVECPPPAGLEETQRIMLGLRPHCAGCHGESAGELGYFASLEAFVTLLVTNERLVLRGRPSESRLVQLLEGNGSGGTTQMPLAGAPYSRLSDAALSMEEVRRWVSELGVIEVNTSPDADAATVSRLPSRLFARQVPALLGIEIAYPNLPQYYAVEYPDVPTGAGSSSLYYSFGGASARDSTTANDDVHATFVQYIGPMSQRWCGLSVAKEDSPLFTSANAEVGMGAPEDVRRNISEMMLYLLGVVADEEELDFLVAEVFAPLEAETDSRTAWTGVCSALLRDPRFVLF